jgi:hypothetical protein
MHSNAVAPIGLVGVPPAVEGLALAGTGLSREERNAVELARPATLAELQTVDIYAARPQLRTEAAATKD